MIHGVIKYDCSSKGKFSGTLKLHNNPSSFDITTDNVVLRGSVLIKSKQVDVLVLNVGMDCIGM